MRYYECKKEKWQKMDNDFEKSGRVPVEMFKPRALAEDGLGSS